MLKLASPVTSWQAQQGDAITRHSERALYKCQLLVLNIRSAHLTHSNKLTTPFKNQTKHLPRTNKALTFGSFALLMLLLLLSTRPDSTIVAKVVYICICYKQTRERTITFGQTKHWDCIRILSTIWSTFRRVKRKIQRCSQNSSAEDGQTDAARLLVAGGRQQSRRRE